MIAEIYRLFDNKMSLLEDILKGIYIENYLIHIKISILLFHKLTIQLPRCMKNYIDF